MLHMQIIPYVFSIILISCLAFTFINSELKTWYLDILELLHYLSIMLTNKRLLYAELLQNSVSILNVYYHTLMVDAF